MNNKKTKHTISLVSKLAKSGDVMINIEDGIIKVNSIKEGVKKTNKKQPTYNTYFKNIAILLIGLVSGFLTISYININNTSNNNENFCLVKIMRYLMNKLFYRLFLVFYQEAFKVTKNQSEDESIINAANYTEIKIYNPLESLNDDDAVIPIAYYKNNYQADELRKNLKKI